LFPVPTDATTEVDWQKVACGVALVARLAVITGGPRVARDRVLNLNPLQI